MSSTQTARKGNKRFVRTAVATAALAALGFGTVAQATDYTWDNGNATALWDDALNWTLDSGYPSTTSDKAILGTTGATTISLNSLTQTVGELNRTGGTYTINNGTLSLDIISGTANVPTTINANITDASGAGLTHSRTSNTDTINGVMTLTGSLIKSGGGTLAITNAGSAAAGVNLNAGTLQFRNNAASNFTGLGTITVGGSATIYVDRVSSGSALTHTLGSLSLGASTLTVTNGNSFIASFGGLTLTGAGTLSNSAPVVVTGGIGGAFDLVKSNTGTLTINTAGSTRVQTDLLSNGTTVLAVADALGASGSVLNVGNGTASARANVTADGGINSGATVNVGARGILDIQTLQTAGPTVNVAADGTIGGNFTNVTYGTVSAGAIVMDNITNPPGSIVGMYSGVSNADTGGTIDSSTGYAGFAITAMTSNATDVDGTFTDNAASGNMQVRLLTDTTIGTATFVTASGQVDFSGTQKLTIAASGLNNASGAQTLNFVGTTAQQNSEMVTLSAASALRSGQTVNVTNAKVNPSNAASVADGATVNIGAGATLAPGNSPTSGTFNINSGGALYVNSATRLDAAGTQAFTLGAGATLWMDIDVTGTGGAKILSAIQNADIIVLDDSGADDFDSNMQGLKAGVRISTPSSQSADFTGGNGVTTVGAVTLTAASGRTLTFADALTVGGGTGVLTAGSSTDVEYITGGGNATRVTAASSGTVQINNSGSSFGNVVVDSGTLQLNYGGQTYSQTLTIGSGAKMDLGDDTTWTGAISNSGRLTVNKGNADSTQKTVIQSYSDVAGARIELHRVAAANLGTAGIFFTTNNATVNGDLQLDGITPASSPRPIYADGITLTLAGKIWTKNDDSGDHNISVGAVNNGVVNIGGEVRTPLNTGTGRGLALVGDGTGTFNFQGSFNVDADGSMTPMSIVNVVPGLGGTFTIAGDQTALYVAGGKFAVRGSTGNDGPYTIQSVTLNGGNTDIVVGAAENIPNSTVDGTTAFGSGDELYKVSIGNATMVTNDANMSKLPIARHRSGNQTLEGGTVAFEFQDGGVWDIQTSSDFVLDRYIPASVSGTIKMVAGKTLKVTGGLIAQNTGGKTLTIDGAIDLDANSRIHSNGIVKYTGAYSDTLTSILSTGNFSGSTQGHQFWQGGNVTVNAIVDGEVNGNRGNLAAYGGTTIDYYGTYKTGSATGWARADTLGDKIIFHAGAVITGTGQFATSGDGLGGQIEMAADYVDGGTLLGMVRLSGGDYVTNHTQNLPTAATGGIQLGGSTWIVKTNAQTFSGPVQSYGTAGPSTGGIQTDTDLTLTGSFTWYGNDTVPSVFTKSGAGTLNINGTQSYLPATLGALPSMAVTAGTVNLNTNAGSSSSHNLTLNVSGGVANFGADQHLQKVVSSVAGGVNLAGYAARTYDLLDEAALNAQVAAGQIVDSTIGANPWQIGITDLATDDLSAPIILVKVTRKGDANLDGTTNFNDLLRLSQNYNLGGKLFDEADFNYDGTVNFNDLLILSQNYNQSYPAPSPAAAAVPEPGVLGVLAMGAMGLLARRRRA